VIGVWHYLAVAAVLFGLGLVGFLTRRNLITMFLCAELMLQGVVLNLVAFSKFHGNLSGQVFGLVVITVAACEAGMAMALFVLLYRRAKTLDASDWQGVREDQIPAAPEEAGPPMAEPAPAYPTLTPAGARPSAGEEAPARV
jgi:NADH-quinone oxidoreductase subunit K